MFCPECGTNLSVDAEFCSNCGTLLNNANTPTINQVKKSKSNKKIILIIIGIIITALAITIVLWFIKSKSSNNYGSINKKNEISYSYSEGNIPKFIDGSFNSDIVNSSSDVLKALESIKDEMKFKDISKELKLSSTETSEDVTYYKFDQIYRNVPVYKQNIIVMVDKQGKITGLSGYYIPNIDINVTPTKSKEDVESVIKEKLGENPNIISNELYVWAEYESQSLIYVVKGYSNTNAAEFIVDANTGEIITEISVFDYSNTYSYTGTGMDNKTYTINLEEYFDLLGGSKTRYRFYDLEKRIAVADYRLLGPIFSTLYSAIPGNITPMVVDIKNGKIDITLENETFIQSAITAMANYETIYDYYKNVLGRNSYDNKGSKIIINLGVNASTFSNEDLDNAMWNSLTDQMYIGDYNGKSFSASLDVLAHEFTHGVVAHSASFAGTAKKEDKNKAFETGALNEGYADVLGHLIEGKNWTMAENNETLRNAANPGSYKNPSVKGGEHYYPDSYLKDGKTLEQFLKDKNITYVTDYDKGGVHNNSNVVSHAAYLMYEDGAFSSREEMAKVWYNSLLMLSSYSNFEDCALAVIKAAKNFGLSETSIYKITKAFQDTKMLESKDFSLKGTIISGTEKLKDVNVEIYSYNDNSLITSTTSNEKGLYETKLPTGTYKIKVTKKDFEEYTTTVIIKGDTTLDIELASTKVDKDTDILKKVCKTSNCVNFTIYFLEGDEPSKLKEKYETYAVDKGTVMDANIIVDAVNGIFKSKILSTDGKSFYITIVEDFKVEFGWYYKDTDTKFDWNQAITKDTEIEMKLFNGLFDDDTFDTNAPNTDLTNDKTGAFLMPINDVFSISGKGTVVTGRIERGTISIGDTIQIIGLNHDIITTTVLKIEYMKKELDSAKAGDVVGIVLKDVSKDDIEIGQVLAQPN